MNALSKVYDPCLRVLALAVKVLLGSGVIIHKCEEDFRSSLELHCGAIIFSDSQLNHLLESCFAL